ncbi:MAG: hypothetical protein ACI4KM_03520 [Oscillospiraceae bacterium]
MTLSTAALSEQRKALITEFKLDLDHLRTDLHQRNISLLCGKKFVLCLVQIEYIGTNPRLSCTVPLTRFSVSILAIGI